MSFEPFRGRPIPVKSLGFFLLPAPGKHYRCDNDVIAVDEWDRSSASLVVVDKLISEGVKRHGLRRRQWRKSFTTLALVHL